MTAATSLLFGQEIRQRRRAKDITQADLAQRIGCVASAVHEVERRCRPVTEFARAIDFVEALECGRDAESLLIKAAQERGSVDIRAGRPGAAHRGDHRVAGSASAPGAGSSQGAEDQEAASLLK